MAEIPYSVLSVNKKGTDIKKLPKRFGLKSLGTFDKFTMTFHTKTTGEIVINGVSREGVESINKQVFSGRGRIRFNSDNFPGNMTAIAVSDIKCHEVSPEQSWTEDML